MADFALTIQNICRGSYTMTFRETGFLLYIAACNREVDRHAKAVRAALGLSSAVVSRVGKALERDHGYITRTIAVNDERNTVYTLTEAGSVMAAKLNNGFVDTEPVL